MTNCEAQRDAPGKVFASNDKVVKESEAYFGGLYKSLSTNKNQNVRKALN